MASNNGPQPPVSTAEKAKNFLAYGFVISIALHLIVGPFIHFERTQTTEEQPQKVTVIKVPTPPPTPPPTPTPKPTPPPTPPPKATPPPKQTPAPVQPKIKINTIKQTAKSNNGPTERGNTHTEGVTQGIPQGIGTGPPSTAPPATPAPATATPKPTPTPLACAHPNVPAGTDRAVEPDMPAMAQQQGITGDVQVVVSLDQTSHVTQAKIQSSPSVVLNQAALSAARQSTFHTEVRNCQPIAADYLFVVTFSSQ
jgi:periplasmic protein TonB